MSVNEGKIRCVVSIMLVLHVYLFGVCRAVPQISHYFFIHCTGNQWFHISERPPHLFQISAGGTSVWAREKTGKIWQQFSKSKRCVTLVNSTSEWNDILDYAY